MFQNSFFETNIFKKYVSLNDFQDVYKVFPKYFELMSFFPFFHFHKINIDCILDLTLKCENTHLWNLNRASDCRSATGVRNCTNPRRVSELILAVTYTSGYIYIFLAIENQMPGYYI